ncbi:SH3 domain-containing protein [Flavobacterium humi]|uniref:SH3 domain-containing protein n=1 Tax=Flavobacterium humi TaxID=2562683 RepID=A0A4Z0L8M4_9FLAO|nr:SH3 domain-containing protein [Flavobacterium humi]TGD58618.1 SH3 domain-containing protein [Flavobacterium humi]
MRNYFSFLLILSSFFSYSQEEMNHSGYWNQYENVKAMIGAKNCYIRSEASAGSTLLDSLQLGKPVTILNRTENTLKIKGINVSWAEIQYEDAAGKVKSGFVWQGFLALDYVKTKQYVFLTTIDKIEKKQIEGYESEYCSITVKVLDSGNQLLEQKTFARSLNESRFFQNKLIGSLGLSNLEDIYRISFSGEACGIPTFYFYFGWTGKELLSLPEKEEVGDAGVYYHSEQFIFPKEKNGQPGLIFKEVEEAENTDESGEIFDVTTWKETYAWDGRKAVFKKKGQPKKYRKKLN